MITVSLKKDLRSNFPEGQGFFLIRDVNYRMSNYQNKWRPPVDIYETHTHIIVLVEIAGVQEGELSIIFNKDILTINGTRLFPIEEKRAVHQIEIPFGEFSCEIALPSLINEENIEASYRNGFLRIDLPKATPHHIQVETNEG